MIAAARSSNGTWTKWALGIVGTITATLFLTFFSWAQEADRHLVQLEERKAEKSDISDMKQQLARIEEQIRFLVEKEKDR